MDCDAATLLARTHATLVRQLSEIAGHHFEGLQAAARYETQQAIVSFGHCIHLVPTRHFREVRHVHH